MQVLGTSRSNAFLPRLRPSSPMIVIVVMTWSMTFPDFVQSAGFKSPEECLAYTGDAHLNCVYAYIEIQKEKISKLEEELHLLKGTANALQEKVNRQSSLTQNLQRRIDDQNQQYQEFRYPRFRPSLGFSYYSGPPYRYGRLFGPYYGFGYGPYSPYYW